MNELLNPLILLMLTPFLAIGTASFMQYMKERRQKELLVEAEELQIRLANIKREAEKKLNAQISRILEDGHVRMLSDFQRFEREEWPAIEAKKRAELHAVTNEFIASQTKTIQYLNGIHK